ncbi:MAG: hypothetical protein ACK52S_09385, partial [Pirellula sp.]
MTTPIGDGSQAGAGSQANAVSQASAASQGRERLGRNYQRLDTDPCNVGLRLTEQAFQKPDQLAIATPVGSHRRGTSRRYHTITMEDLDHRSTTLAAGFQAMGRAGYATGIFGK